MDNVKVIVKEIEDIRYAENVLTRKEIEFLNTYYEFEYDDNTTIKDILIFYIQGLKEYYTRTRENINLCEEGFLKNTFELFYDEETIRIFDLNNPISQIMKIINKDKLELKYLIGVGGGFDALPKTNGVRYWMNTRESGKHNLPHIHVKYNDEEVIIDILNGNVLGGKIQKRKLNDAISKIQANKKSLLFLWNTKTDGQTFEIGADDLYLDI